jgi:hypothetical protein
MSTYLQLVNEVLVRLREPQVTAITNNNYSLMIGKFINDTKRQVEDAWNWDALGVTVTGTTSAGTTNYLIVGSSIRHKGVTINNTTSKYKLLNAPIQWIIDQQQLTTTQSGSPSFYAWNGTDGTDSKVELYPTPDGIYTLKFNMYVPQVNLNTDADTLLVPPEPVILGAYARALVERGEDQGMTSSEAYALFKSSLSDHIAIESNRYIENDCWIAV